VAKDRGEHRQAAGTVSPKINYATACAFSFLRHLFEKKGNDEGYSSH